MIKRRFYKLENGDKDNDVSDSSTSSSSSASDLEETDDAVTPVEQEDNGSRSNSGYESEDSLGNELDADSSGLSTNKDSGQLENDPTNLIDSIRGKANVEMLKRQSNLLAEKDSVPDEVEGCILKCKSVFKCRLCPRIVCLTEETLRTHLMSKRHTRSEKLLKEGRLKRMLNSDGEIEEGEETHTERHARFVALKQGKGDKKKNKGRQRQRKRSRDKKLPNKLNTGNAMQSTGNATKKRRKSENLEV